jgi:hypothetical protein
MHIQNLMSHHVNRRIPHTLKINRDKTLYRAAQWARHNH